MNQEAKNSVSFQGVARAEHYPARCPEVVFREIIICEEMEIPAHKPAAEQILVVTITTDIEHFETVKTPLDVKLVVKGKLCEKVLYAADLPQQPVHVAEFEKRFTTFIVLPPGFGCVRRVCALVEYAAAELSGSRLILKDVLLLVFAQIEVRPRDRRKTNGNASADAVNDAS